MIINIVINSVIHIHVNFSCMNPLKAYPCSFPIPEFLQCPSIMINPRRAYFCRDLFNIFRQAMWPYPDPARLYTNIHDKNLMSRYFPLLTSTVESE